METTNLKNTPTPTTKTNKLGASSNSDTGKKIRVATYYVTGKTLEMTEEMKKLVSLYPLYSQDGIKEKRVLFTIKLIGTEWKWIVYEGDLENGDYTFFGYVESPIESEYGYFSLNELKHSLHNYLIRVRVYF